MVKDLDGTLIGKPGAILANNPGVANGTCVRVDEWNGFKCVNEISDEFDFAQVSFEEIGWDHAQIYRPFIFNNTKFYNKVTPNMDNKEEIYDISGERPPRYQTLIRKNDSYTMWNIGRKPKHWRW